MQHKPKAPSTDRERYQLDATRRWPTRHRGISYRLNRSLERSYFVYHAGRFEPAGDALEAALVKQGELRKARSRGEAPVLNTKTTFGELSQEWFEIKLPKLRPRTAEQYEDALRLVLRPRWGSWRIAAIDADAISKLVHDLQKEGLHAIDRNRPARPLGYSSVENYLLPAQGTLAFAVRRRLISVNPFDILTADDRPAKGEKRAIYVPTEEEITALIEASEDLARRPEARYKEYPTLLRVAARLGPRQGEVLGPCWTDFDKDEPALTIERQWGRNSQYGPPKTRAGRRRIPLPADLRDELIALRLRSKFSQDSDPIFASKAGTPLSHRNLTRRGFEAARDEAGLPKNFRFHDLRHYCASRLISKGLDPVTVASVMGHEDATTTLRVYSHLFDRRRADDAVRLALAGSSA